MIGKYVVEMLDGQLESSLARKWAWDRDIPSTENNGEWPRRELEDLVD